MCPEDRSRAADAIRRALTGESPIPVDLRMPAAAGDLRVLEVTLTPHRQDEHTAGLIGTAVDVTDRREQEAALRRAEAEYRQLMQSVQAIVWRADAATMQFRFVSQEAEALLRYPLSRWLQEPAFWRDHLHPDDRDWVQSLRDRAAREGREHEAEYRMITADGRVLWVRDIVRVRSGHRRAPELFGVTIDVTERHRAEEELRRSREQLSDLSAHLEWVREEERSAIAREIHDELGQALTALRMDLSWVRGHLPAAGAGPEATLARLRSMEELIDDTIGRARRICSELRPGVLDDLGLEAAVEWQAQEFERRTGVRCEAVAGGRLPRLERDVATALFRILQESLTNVARHAAASRVRVELRQEGGRVVLEVTDDGRGAAQTPPPGHRSLGVLGMKERARRLGGTLTLTGAAGKGTVVQASIPLPAAKRSSPETLPVAAPRLPATDPRVS